MDKSQGIEEFADVVAIDEQWVWSLIPTSKEEFWEFSECFIITQIIQLLYRKKKYNVYMLKEIRNS